jgi:hypothetical protein
MKEKGRKKKTKEKEKRRNLDWKRYGDLKEAQTMRNKAAFRPHDSNK